MRRQGRLYCSHTRVRARGCVCVCVCLCMCVCVSLSLSCVCVRACVPLRACLHACLHACMGVGGRAGRRVGGPAALFSCCSSVFPYAQCCSNLKYLFTATATSTCRLSTKPMRCTTSTSAMPDVTNPSQFSFAWHHFNSSSITMRDSCYDCTHGYQESS